MKFTLILVFVFIFSFAKAQPKEMIGNDDMKIYTAVEREPEFHGGLEGFHRYIYNHVHYRAKLGDDLKTRLYIEMIIEKDGTLSHIKILKGISKEFDRQVVIALKKCPKWQPGVINDRPVRVRYILPIIFEFHDEDN